jgi:hypothetical protein
MAAYPRDTSVNGHVTANGKVGKIMDFVALLISVEMTRRETHSALPGARVRPEARRWGRLRAAVRRLARGSDPAG